MCKRKYKRTFSTIEKQAEIMIVAVYPTLFFVALFAWEISPQVIGLSILLGTNLILLSIIDLRTLLLPNSLNFFLLTSGLIGSWYFSFSDVSSRVLASIIGFFFLFGIDWIYQKYRGRKGIGLGDAKLFAASGAWIGWEGLPTALLWSSLCAALVIVLGLLIGFRIARTSRIPFGPFLSLGIWLVWLFGPLQ